MLQKNAMNAVVTVVGIALAKSVSALHGILAAGKPVLFKPHVPHVIYWRCRLSMCC